MSVILTTKKKFGIVAVGALTAALGASIPAHADYAPQPGDVVAVGGDTPQFDLAFGADGDTAGDQGYNSTGNINRLVTFNATADANARAAYADGSTLANPNPLNPTIVLRAGTNPVQRPQSSGAAISALLNDTGATHKINFVFSASEPTSAQQGTANDPNHKWGYLHVVQIGDDAVRIAADTTTHAPAALTTAQLLGIYDGTFTKWTDVGGTSSNAIVPLLPPSSSSIYKTFLKDLQSANGGNPVNLAPSVKTVEQNDPTAITAQAASADAIVPFSSARFSLFAKGYFHDPSTPFPGGAAISPGTKLLTGSGAYDSVVKHYVIFRESDTTAKAFQPGGTLNWIQTLFSNPGGTKPFFARSTGQALIAAAGTTPAYADLGNVSSG
jgi:ABC-type phosphate transport system substrate-binding protein